MSDDNEIKQTKDFWIEHSQSWRSSGLTQLEYCERTGINYRSFIYQHNRILSQERVSGTAFIEVKSGFTAATNQLPTAGLQLMLPNGVRIGITSEVTSELLKTVLTLAGGL
jgi:hypothetical protein